MVALDFTGFPLPINYSIAAGFLSWSENQCVGISRMYKNVLEQEKDCLCRMKKISVILFLLMILTTSVLPMSIAIADLPPPSQEKMGPTFNAEGTINTLTGNNSTWVLGGDWNFQAINGVTDKLDVDMTMIALNGTDRHHMLITNFTQSEDNLVNMTNDGTININGTSDVYGHGKLKWSAVPLEILIDRYSVLHAYVDNNQTEDHFNGGIHGITNSFANGFDFTEKHEGMQ
jgi:hypothetical protein